MRISTTLTFLLIAMSVFGGNEKYRLLLRDDPATTIVVGWNQVSGSNPVVYYGTIDHGTNWSAYPSSQVVSRSVSHKGMNNHFTRLTGLQPNTAYYFVIRDNEGTSQRFWFKTAPNDPSQRLSFIAGGDSRNNRTPRQNANRLVAKLKPHAVLFGGDMTDSGSNAQWDDWFDDWQLTISSDGRMYPLVAARGNHEGSNNDLVHLFDVPHNSVYYALTFGNGLVRTYTLNTEISISGSQTSWLSNDLSSNGNVIWKMAQYHKPMRPHVSSKSEGNNQYNDWANLFYNHNVKLVVECDAHTVKTTWPVRPSTGGGSDEGFIRDDQNGTVYVGEGCWGAPLRSNNDDKNWTRNSGQFNQFKWIFVDDSKIEVRTIRVDNASSVGEVSNNNPFTIPSNLDIWNPSNGSLVTILNNNVVLPTVSLTAPADGAYYPAPQSVTFSANASDSDGSVDKVEFYVNGGLVGTDYSSPYALNYSIPSNGSYTIGAKAFDNEGNTQEAATRSIHVGVVSETIEKRIASSMDDVEEHADGSMYTNSSDIELVADGSRGNQKIGLRFTSLNIPQGATVDRAYIQFTVDETNSGGTSLTIKGHDADDASAFTTSTGNVSSRTTTSANVFWNPPSWSSVGASGSDQRTPEIKSIVQEIVDRGGWSSGNDMVFIITGTGERTAEAYDGVAGSAALLYLEYTLGSSEPIVINDPSGLNATPVSSSAIDLTWSDNSSNEDGFKIERRIGAGSWSQLVTVGSETTTYSNMGLSQGTSYSYRVRAYKGSDHSNYSNTASATTQTAPTNCGDPTLADESFESSFGNWTNASGDDINWTRGSGGTPSNGTGPSGASSGSYYSYLEASNPNYPNKVANLISDCLDFTGFNDPVLSFDYQMLGSSVGTLNVQVRSTGGSWSTLWSKIGDQGSSWNSASIDLSTYSNSSEVEIQFNGTTGSSWQGDICIDHITFTEGGGTPPPVTETFSKRISDGNDDVEENQNGGMYMNSSDLELVYDGSSRGNQRIGLRWRAVTVPQGATITEAYIQFNVDETTNSSGTKTIWGEDVNDASAFSTSTNNVSNRVKTSASVNWNPPTWNAVGAEGLDQRTPDLSTIVQEIVNRGGWSGGNDMVFIITGSGRRTAESFDGSSSRAPKLIINYSTEGAGTRTVGQTPKTQVVDDLFESTEKFIVYPNPSYGDISIDVHEEWDGGILQVFSIDGALILSRQISFSDEPLVIKSEQLNPGVYFFRATNGKLDYQSKIIKH